MLREHERLPSEAMGRPMHVWRFGHYGQPVIVFPSASGMAHEWEAHGMTEALSDLLEAGRIKLYCTESNVSESWTNRKADPAWRIRRHIAFERYVVGELVPYVRRDCRASQIRLASAGTSLGAYYAANVTLKYPSLFGWALCMSGRYDATWLTDGFSNGDVYFNDPMAYLPGLEGELLERVRAAAHLVLVCGQGQWENGNTESARLFAEVLRSKGIPHECDLWGHDVSHEWPWWRRQARYHLARAFGGQSFEHPR